MKNLFLIAILGFFLSGCSILPRLTFDRPNTLPQETSKTKKNVVCSGEYSYDPQTGVQTCSKGFKNSEDLYNNKERKLTLKEKLLNMLANIQGYFFWIVVALIFFFPGAIGWILGRLLDGAKKLAQSTLKVTSKAIGEWRKEMPDNLSDETKLVVDALFDKLEDAHSQDPEMIKLIGDIRTQLKIEDNDPT